MTRAPRLGGWPAISRPQIRWVASNCAAITTTITGVRLITKSLKLRCAAEADDDVGRIADQRRGGRRYSRANTSANKNG